VIDRRSIDAGWCIILYLLLITCHSSAADWFGKQEGNVCDYTLVDADAAQEGSRCSSLAHGKLNSLPNTCKLARVSIVPSNEAYFDLIAGPHLFEGSLQESWRIYETRRIRELSPSCQILRFGAQRSLFSMSTQGKISGDGGLRLEFLPQSAAALRLVHFSLEGKPESGDLTLFFSGADLPLRVVRKLVTPLADVLAVHSTTMLAVRVAKWPWFFGDDTFPSRSPWIVPDGVSLSAAISNRSTSCVRLRGKVRCYRR
jgi:hypothetical protein